MHTSSSTSPPDGVTPSGLVAYRIPGLISVPQSQQQMSFENSLSSMV
jgi:hypothetical protein